MKEVLIYDNESFEDLTQALGIILRYLNVYKDFFVTGRGHRTRLLSSYKLVRYEKHSRFYRFVYTDHEVQMDARAARKLIHSRYMPGFVSINCSDVVNIGYVSGVDGNTVYLSRGQGAFRLADDKRENIEKYVKRRKVCGVKRKHAE